VARPGARTRVDDGTGAPRRRRLPSLCVSGSSRGLANQGWKDSFDAVMHADGRLSDRARGGASVSVRGARRRRRRRRGPRSARPSDAVAGTCAPAPREVRARLLDGERGLLRARAGRGGPALPGDLVQSRPLPLGGDRQRRARRSRRQAPAGGGPVLRLGPPARCRRASDATTP
jgi:hypothetical protein